jgi:hypothetical protein
MKNRRQRPDFHEMRDVRQRVALFCYRVAMVLPIRAISTLAIVACVLVSGCDADDDGAAVPGCESSAGDSVGTPIAVAIAVDCSFSFAGEQIDVTYQAGDGRIETPVGGKLVAGGMLDDSEFEGRSFSMIIYAEDSSVLSSSLYQMDQTRLPTNEFWGDHGFTGLHGVKDPEAQENVQFACFAREPTDPPHSWEE